MQRYRRAKGKSNTRPLCQKDTRVLSWLHWGGGRARARVREQQLGWSLVTGHWGFSSSGDMDYSFPLLQRGWLGLQDSIQSNYPFGNVATQYIAPDSPRMSHAWKMRNNPFSFTSPQMAAVTKTVWKNQTSPLIVRKYTKGESPCPRKMSPKAKENGEDNRGFYEDLRQAALQAANNKT